MLYNHFRSGKDSISRIGFGAMGLGGMFGTVDEQTSIRALHNSLEQGVNFIDTARAYGDSELILGKALKQWKGKKPFIASKVESQAPGGVGWGRAIPVQSAYPGGSIRKSAETSLKLLGIETIDLMQTHQYWPHWDRFDYWMEEFMRLKEEGKIRYIGISIPDQRHDIALPIVLSGKIDSVQTVFNIFDPLPLDCLIPFCHEQGIAVIARCILDEGGLSGFLKEDTVFEATDYRNSYFNYVPKKQYIERVDRLRKFIPQYADSLAELAIKFVLHHPGVTVAISSMHIPQYANENIRALDKPPLPDDIFEEIFKHHRWVRNFYETKFFS